jgi:protease I
VSINRCFQAIPPGEIKQRTDPKGDTDMASLKGRRVAFIAADGVEQVELTEPWKAVEQAGGQPELISIEPGKVKGFNHFEPGDEFDVDKTFADAAVDDYDGLVVPGGVHNPDQLRSDDAAVAFVKAFFAAGKPVAAICHGPWVLVEADVVEGRTLTSFPSIQTDIRNAGGEWVDEEVHVDHGLTTSRQPDDLPAFCEKLVEEIAEGVHEEQKVSA